MVLETFNKELYEKNLKADAYEEGVQDGLKASRKEWFKLLIKEKLTKGKSVEEIADALEENVETIRQMIEEISKE